MHDRSGSWTVAFVLASAGVAAIVGATAASFTLVGSTGAAFAAAAVAAVIYRDRRDPTALLIGIGALAYAVSLTAAIAGAELYVGLARDDPFAVTTGSAGTAAYGSWYEALRLQASVRAFGALPGLGGIAGCLLFVVPWRDRRGRPPMDPRRVAVAVGAPVLIATIALVVARPVQPGWAVLAEADPATAPSTGAAAMAALIVVVAAISTARTLTGRTRRTVAAASLAIMVAAGGVLVVALVDDGTTSSAAGWTVASTMPLLGGLLLLAGLLSMVRLETSRLRRTSDRAEEILGGRAEIASMLAHEVKGPVSTIKGLAATTSGSYEKLSDAERREFVGLIEDEASRLLGIVDQTSIALKIDAGALTYERRPHDLAAVVRDGVAAADVGDHPVHTALGDGLTATVDRRWLALAVRQGVDNAARFSPDGSPIEVTLTATDGHAVIGISDRGPGVPPERRAEIFDRFARWRPPGYEDRQGSGLGLFICRGILAEHAGDASLDAGPEGGTMLRLTIPLGAPPMEG